jgi:nuclear pore complex protein Nup133
VLETNEAILGALYNAAFKIRDAYKASSYYLFPEDFCEVAPWTSTPEIINVVESQYRATMKYVRDDQTKKAQHQLIMLVETLCIVYSERLDWLVKAGDKYISQGRMLSEKYTDQCGDWIRLLVELDYVDDAIRISEKFELYRSLVELLVPRWNMAKSAGDLPRERKVHDMIDEYLSRYGSNFANVMYQYLLETKDLKTLLNEFSNYHMYLDDLFAKGRQGRISWVRDIRKGDYGRASKSLANVAFQMELSNYNQRLQLSIAKLSALATGKTDNDTKYLVGEINGRIQVIDIQEQIRTQIQEVIRRDGEGYQIYSDSLTKHLRDRGAIAQLEIVKRCLSRLVEQQALTGEELVDVLTSIDCNTENSKLNFYLALKLISISAVKDSQLNEKLVWRRLLLRDDWNSVVDTKKKSDAKVAVVTEGTLLFKTLATAADNGILSQLSKRLLLDPKLTETNLSHTELQTRYPSADDSTLGRLGAEFAQESDTIASLSKELGLASWTKSIYLQVERQSTDVSASMEVDA